MSRHPSRPRVTVLLPVHDAAPFLGAAIESVLRQTWTDLALLVLDDGSTDTSAAIAATYAAADPRVRVERWPHRGLVATLNAGLAMADGELIARADADDVNEPERLAQQVALLDARPDIGVCGTAVRTVPGGPCWTLPTDADELRACLILGPPCYHPTVMMRREWLARSGLAYDPAASHAEDYDLWDRADRHTRFANLTAPLVRYRRHPGQVSIAHAAAQSAVSRAIRLRRLRDLGLEPDAAETAAHEALATGIGTTDAALLAAVRRWLEQLVEANRRTARYAEPAFTRLLAFRWYRLCAESAQRGTPSVAEFRRAPIIRALPDPGRRALRLQLLRMLPAAPSRRLARWLIPSREP